MIVYDTPTIWKPSYGPSSHLISTLLNPIEARKELLDFGADLGLKPTWLQKRSIPWHTHFDIWGWRLEAVRKTNAICVPRKDFVVHINNKKEHYFLSKDINK